MSAPKSICLAFAFGLAANAAAVVTQTSGLYFEPNVGQFPEPVKFMARGKGYAAALTPSGATFRHGTSTLQMEFVTAQPSAVLVPADALQARIHYLTGGAEWHTDVVVYRLLECREVYPGVNVRYYDDGSGNLKYDLILHPGSEPAQIRLQFHGAGNTDTDTNGDILVRTDTGLWRHTAPEIYQVHSGIKHALSGRFQTRGPGIIGVDIRDYDHSTDLIIDPTVAFSSYVGGTGQDTATSVALDSGGNMYIAGWTESVDFPEAPSNSLGIPGGIHVYVAKLSPTGKLIYLTYLGGGGDDRGYGIAVDTTGEAVVTGWTYSTNFPVVSPAQAHLAGVRDAFVAKLNSAGNGLIFSTYLGGSGADAGNAVALDQQGNIYVAGETASSNLPVLNPLQSQIGGGMDAFVAKFNSTGTRLYGTYLGGAGDDRATAIAVDGSENAYITGSTYSPNFPTANAFQSKLAGGQDAFAAKIAATGSTLMYSTYLGGTGSAPETGSGIAVDASGCAYIAGTTTSADFPVSNPFQSSLAGMQDAFVLKLNSSGNALAYSTYLGGSSIDAGTAIALDSSGRAYVAGYTASPDFPIVNAIQSTEAGGYDEFLVRLSSAGSALEWSTYIGGSGSDSANGIALDASGNVYVAGQTTSFNFPLASPLQTYPSAPLSASVYKVAPTGTAAFIKFDTSTQGNWNASYGADGYSIASDATVSPIYSQTNIASQFSGAWTTSTTDVRALQKSSGTGRVAALWGAWAVFTVDLNITDGASHQVALYCLDWDSTLRQERIDVMDATGIILDSRTVSNFNSGTYLVWNISGHVTFQITCTAGANAVLSGIFFGGRRLTPSASAAFVKQDGATQGNWKSVYGADGGAIFDDYTQFPSYSQVTINSQFSGAWTMSTTDVRALQKSAASDRIASLWGAWSSFTIDVNTTDGASHQIALYALDWDSNARNECIDVLDYATGLTLDSRTLSGFNAGQYLVWNVRGHVSFRVTLSGGTNAVISGIFFGGSLTNAPATANFLKRDITTQGSWKGAYGADGGAISDDYTQFPAYAQVTINSQFTGAWAISTADVRALEKSAASDRIASLWGAWSSFTIDVNITDVASHQIAFYCLDWDNDGRSERIDVLDASSGAVIDTQTISAFSNGVYLVWNVSRHTTFRITALAGNAVVSGVFFR